MSRPVILVSPHTEKEGGEFPDASQSLSNRYVDALLAAGGLPLVLPCTELVDQATAREAVQRASGLLFTGGEDVDPALYTRDLPPDILASMVLAEKPRDLFECLLVDEAFRQAKPVLAICRGQQIVNVALGGTLVGDIPLQRPGALRHNRPAERFQPVHDIRIDPDSNFARIVGPGPLGVNSTHHQAVDQVAPPLRPVGWSSDGLVEALELAPEFAARHPFFLSVQFHPERLHDRHPEHARIFAAFVAACAAQVPW